MAVKVGINGFGRIGRQVLKAIRDYHAADLEVVLAIGELDLEVAGEVGGEVLGSGASGGSEDRRNGDAD